MLHFILVGLIAVFLILSLSWFITYWKYQRYLKKYRGPTCLPIVGNMHNFGDGTDYLPYLMSCTEKYGKTIRFMFGFMPRLFFSDIKLIEFVLSSNSMIEKSFDYYFFRPWLGFGLLTSTGARWRHSRKLLTPTFHFKILERFVEIFDKQGNTLVKTIEKFEGKEVNIFPHVTLFALDVICEAAMSTTVNAQLNADSDYVLSVKEICRIILDRSLSLFKMFDALYIFSKDYQKEKKALTVVHGYTNSVINRRRQEIEKNPVEQPKADDDDGIGSKRRMNCLDLLLQCQADGKPLPQELIREEVDTFMFAGHDTTTSGISFALYVLSKHPDIQEKVFEEVQNICFEENRPITYNDLQEMKYLEQVIKECLRMYPPATTISRCLTEDVEYDGQILPKGLDLTINIYALHQNPELYPNPHIFDPERFTTENSRSRSHYAFIPFSAGPRNCIGQRFAMLEIKATVAKIIRNFKLLPALGHEPKLYVDVILKSDNGLPIRFQKRN